MHIARSLGALTVCALLAGGCATSPKVNFDYDHDTNFSSYRTYAWVEPEKPPADPLMRQRIIAAIEEQLADKGLTKAEASPDVYVLAVGGATDETVVDTDHYGYGYGPGWYYGGAPMSSQTTVTRYTRGTLVVDLSDAHTKQLVWRGTATDIMNEDPAVNAEKVRVAVQELFKRYPPAKK
jgi:Domain of unknown function (DUF4136)